MRRRNPNTSNQSYESYWKEHGSGRAQEQGVTTPSVPPNFSATIHHGRMLFEDMTLVLTCKNKRYYRACPVICDT